MGGQAVTFLIIFTLGYLLGGVSALVILGLTIAARRSEHDYATASLPVPAEETVAALRKKG